jgi:hypothetical protein
VHVVELQIEQDDWGHDTHIDRFTGWYVCDGHWIKQLDWYKIGLVGLHVKQVVAVPSQVKQLDEQPHIPLLDILTDPNGHVFTHLVLVADYLKYPDLHAVQSNWFTPQVDKQPILQVEQVFDNVFSKVPSGHDGIHWVPDK